jgi:hypothetical protein
MNFHSPPLVRVSVLFDPPANTRDEGESPAHRYHDITRDTHITHKTLLEWLEREKITYDRVTVMDAFGTIFLDVPMEAVAQLRPVWRKWTSNILSHSTHYSVFYHSRR